MSKAEEKDSDNSATQKMWYKTLCDSLACTRLVGDSNPGLQIQSLLC